MNLFFSAIREREPRYGEEDKEAAGTGTTPRLIAREHVHGLARPVAIFVVLFAIGLKCSSVCSSLTGFSNIITPSSKAGAKDATEPESIITGMPS